MQKNMSRAQRRTLLSLSIIALLLATAWVIEENLVDVPRLNLEPFVVSFASAIPVLSLWWPFRPKYRSQRMNGTVTVSLHNRNTALIGKGEAQFQPYFASNSPTSVHLLTRLHPDHIGSAIAGNANRFEEIKDASDYELSGVDKSPNINDIIILKNRYNNYALLKIAEISDANANTKGKIVKITYVINPSGGVNFS